MDHLLKDILAVALRTRGAQARLESRAAQVEALYRGNEERLAQLEETAVKRIRQLEGSLAEAVEALTLAGATLDELMAVCRRHGYEPEGGLSALEWLDYVLDNAAAGWPSVN